jgi:predicted PurR-regulated permease PerM
MGLIGVATAGFLGMNLFAVSEEPLLLRFIYFLLVLIPTIGLTFFTILKSSRLSDFLETLADERQSLRAKLGAFANVWKAQHGKDKTRN